MLKKEYHSHYKHLAGKNTLKNSGEVCKTRVAPYAIIKAKVIKSR